MRAGTGGDEAGIWAGDLVGTHAFILFVLSNPCRVHEEQCYTHTHTHKFCYWTISESFDCLQALFSAFPLYTFLLL